MSQEANTVMKKFLTQIAKKTISKRKFKMIDDVEIFFVFGSKVKTAMCDWVYGIKLYSNSSLTSQDMIVRDLLLEIKIKCTNLFEQTVCCTDVVIEKKSL